MKVHLLNKTRKAGIDRKCRGCNKSVTRIFLDNEKYTESKEHFDASDAKCREITR